MNGQPVTIPTGAHQFYRVPEICSCLLHKGVTIVLFLSLALSPEGGRAAPEIKELLDHLAMSTAEQKLIFEGDMVSKVLEETSDSELSVGLTFVLPQSPQPLGQIFIGGSKMEMSTQIIAHGDLTPETTVSHLAGVSFRREEADEIDNYLHLGSGNILNLDGNEIAAFNGLAAKGLVDVAARGAVETQLRTNLLNRFQAYRTGGLTAINPYIRDDNERYFLGSDLDRALKAFGFIKFFFPEIYQDLVRFPNSEGRTPKEKYFWVKLISDGRPNFVLSHRMVFSDSDAQILFSRHFYASNSYNGQQEAAILIPFNQGSLVYYNNRTYSDKVGGFGSGVKQAFGKKILSSSLIGLFRSIPISAMIMRDIF